MRSPRDPREFFDAITLRGHPRVQAVPQAERRLRRVFPEVWARYEQLAAERGIRGARPPAAARSR